MSLNVMRLLSLACFVFACLFLTSCGEPVHYTVRAQDVAAIAGESEQKVPLRAGFYMGKSFEMLPVSYGLWTTNMGSTDVEGRPYFEGAVRRMFQEVVPVSATDTIADFQKKNLDVIVTVGSIRCTLELLRGAMSPLESDWGLEVKAKLAAEWSVTSIDGKQLTFTNVLSEEKARKRMDNSGQRDALLKALDAHYRKAYADIVLTGWWKDPSLKSR